MRRAKLLLSVFMLFFLVLGCNFTVRAEITEGVFEEDNIKLSYESNDDGTLSITGYEGKAEKVIIPSEIGGKKVTSVGGFYLLTYNAQMNLKHIVIPEGVTKIQNRAFENCTSLQRVDIPSTVKEIGWWAFKNCINLEFISLPEGITTLKEGIFYNCANNLKNITIPSTVEIIEDDTFYGCRKIKSIDLPESITYIGENAFWWCDSLTKIKIPKNVKEVKKYCFGDCTNLQEVEISEGVEKIEDIAFNNCKSLKKVVLPKSIIYIGKDVFKTYGENELPKDLIIYTDSDSYAKKYAEQQGIKTSCVNQHEKIVTDNAVSPTCTQPGKTEGSHCEACGTVIIEQKTIAPVGHKWDNGSITINPSAISDGEKTYTCVLCGAKRNEKVSRLSLPKQGKVIKNLNTNDTYKVTKSSTQNGTVEFINAKNSKNSITVPDTINIDDVTYKVTSISKNAFKNNKKLKKVTIGKNVKSIGKNAFYGCKNLKSINVKSANLKVIEKNAFKGINPKAKIKVPSNKLKKYKKLLKNKGQKDSVKITK